MSELHIKKPIPIPTVEDYSVAADFVDSDFKDQGGAWMLYHRQSIVEAQLRLSSRLALSQLSEVARFVEPVGDNRAPLDPLFRATHAFRAGMWTGAQLLHVVHNEALEVSRVVKGLEATLPSRVIQDADDYEDNGRHLLTVGSEGIDIIGYDARSKIYEWADDIVSEPTMRKYCALGAGAILYTAHAVYKDTYPSLHENYVIMSTINEIQEYLAQR